MGELFNLFSVEIFSSLTKSSNFNRSILPGFLLVDDLSKISFSLNHVFFGSNCLSNFGEFGNVSFMFVVNLDFLFKSIIEISEDGLLTFKDILQFLNHFIALFLILVLQFGRKKRNVILFRVNVSFKELGFALLSFSQLESFSSSRNVNS